MALLVCEHQQKNTKQFFYSIKQWVSNQRQGHLEGITLKRDFQQIGMNHIDEN